MSNVPLPNIRITPRDGDYLDRKKGSRGEIFYDQDNDSLRLFDGSTLGGYELARTDLANVTNAVFSAKAAAAGISGGGNTTVSVGSSTPASPSSGNLWLNTNNGSLYVYINDGTSSQWMQPSVPFPDLTGLATEVYVDNAITTVNNSVSQVNARIDQLPQFEFNIAGDDSTLRTITRGNTVQFVGSGLVTVSTDTDGIVTINGAASSTGNITFVGTTIDSNDSSSITFTPAVILNSDLAVEHELTVTSNVTVGHSLSVAQTISTSNLIISGEISSQGSGTPEIISDNEILLEAGTRVVIVNSPLKMASFSSGERDALIASNGDVIYNTTTNKFQGRANGVWVDLH